MASAHIYQIFYNERTLAALDPGFIPLDNFSNGRPDWREYWPMRTFLLGKPMADSDYYGFFSPKFKEKTTLGAEQVKEFIDRSGNSADVIIFSPFFDVSALFLNVFEQGDCFHPGLLKVTQDFADRIGLNVSIENMVNDSRNTIFCNYFVAKPSFWAKWLDLNEKLFQISENAPDSDDLKSRLNAVARTRDDPVQMKVLVMERIASLVLATDRTFSTKAYNPLMLGSSITQFRDYIPEAVISDALKISLAEQDYAAYRDAYYRVRAQIAEAMAKKE